MSLSIVYISIEKGVAFMIKRPFALILLVFLLCLTSCVSTSTKEEYYPQWDIRLTLSDVSPTGLTLHCMQTGGKPSGELQTGSYFVLQHLQNDVWNDVDYIVDESQVAWNTIAYMIPETEEVQWDINWRTIYGDLPSGDYRIGKSITEHFDSGESNKKMFYAEFTIE